MAGTAAVHLHVIRVAEHGGPGFLHLENDLLRRRVAGVALGDAERLAPVVAGAARFPLLHFGHADLLVGARRVELVVAGVALHRFQMLGMAEEHRAGLLDLEGDVLHPVAGGALAHAERLLAVVALAARFPLLHILHGGGDLGAARGLVTALATHVGALFRFLLKMHLVAEDNLPRSFRVVGDVPELHGWRSGSSDCECGQNDDCRSASHGFSSQR